MLARMRHGRGFALLDWVVGSALAMLIGTGALVLLAEQIKTLNHSMAQWSQAQELQAIEQALRSELRIAGQRNTPGQSADHDSMVLDPGAGPALHYLCDRCGATDRAAQAGFRLADGVIWHRSLGSRSYQSLNDARSLALASWTIDLAKARDCPPRLKVQLLPKASASPPVDLWIRPRNLGLGSCEQGGR